MISYQHDLLSVHLKTQMNSPTNKLNERWKDFEKTIDREKVLRQANIDRQLNELSMKLSQNTSSNDQTYSQFKERVAELREQIEHIEGTKKEVDKNLQEEIIKVEENFNSEVENEKNKNREDIENWTKNAD